jgi:uncharacterized protein YukE
LRAKESYAKALAHSLTNLTRFVEAARILADAAEQAAEDFRAVDDQSSRSLNNINYMLAVAADREQADREQAARYPGGRPVTDARYDVEAP